MVELADVVLTAGKQRKRGSLSFASSSSATLDFQPRASSSKVRIALADVASLSWWQQFDGFVLRVEMRGGTTVKFSGLKEEAWQPIGQLAKQHSLPLNKQSISTKGTNAQQLQVTDSALLFSVDGSPSFELPLHLIAQCVAQSRNEVALELHHDDAAAGQMDSLVEMRIHIPDQPKRRREDGQSAEGSDAEADEADDADEEADTPAQLFAQLLQVTGDIESTATTPLASFEKLLFSVPRGRYDVDLFPTFLKLASATYTYKIAYKNINKMFLFDAADSSQHLFVIGLNPPVRQGRTAYPYLVVQFDSTEYLEQTFAIDDAKAEEEYGGLMKPSMKGPSYDVVTRVFKACSKKKVLVPGRSFVSSQGSAAIQCSYKASDGHLFFLEKSFFFLKKPPMHIRHAAITSIEFSQLGAANKRFGMKISTSDSKQGEFTFTNIAKDEFDRVVSFMQSKAIHCITQGGEDMQATQQAVQQAAGGRRRAAADDFSEDPYMKRLDAAAEEEDADATDGKQQQVGGDDSDSENDEDFTVGSGESDSEGSEASSDEELESEVDESDSEARKRKRPAANKKGRAAAGKGKKGKSQTATDDEAAAAADGDDSKQHRTASNSKKKQKSPAAAAAGSAGKGAAKQSAAAQSGPTGYQLYAKQNRPLMLIDTPNASFGDISKRIGAKWKAESGDVRADFERKAAEARQAQLQQQRQAADKAETAGTAAGDGGDSRGVKRKKPSANSAADSAQQTSAESDRGEETKEMEVEEREERKESAD